VPCFAIVEYQYCSVSCIPTAVCCRTTQASIFVVYAGDINILGGYVQTVNKNTEILEVAVKKIGLNINDEKTKNMVTTRDQNVEQNHNINIDNSSFETVEQFTYLGITLRNQNSIHVENENRLNSGNAEFFSFFLRNIWTLKYTTLSLCLLFCMGVRLGL
jgi:hypothetical protein